MVVLVKLLHCFRTYCQLKKKRKRERIEKLDKRGDATK